MKKEQYIKEVLKNVYTYRATKKRLIEDLETTIDEGLDRDVYFDPVSELGTPVAFAQEFMDNISESEGSGYRGFNGYPYEYKSTKTLFGLPLVHINTSGRYGASVAKGVIAIGDIAIGGFTIGGVSFGIVSIGGISIGLCAMGGVAIGALALGGVAIGAIALGGVAIGIVKAIGAALFIQ